MGDFWANDSVESGFSAPIAVENIMVWLRCLVGEWYLLGNGYRHLVVSDD